MAKEKRTNPFKDEFDGEYIGNIFGWKFSLVGAVVIIGSVIFTMYLSNQQKNQAGTTIETAITKDSINTNQDTLDIH